MAEEKLTAEKESKLGLGFQIRNAYFALRRCSNFICQKHDSNGDQFVVLKFLADSGSLTQKELGDLAGHDSSTIAAMIRTLENRGLIEREKHPEDSRAKLVKLTSSGKKMQRILWKETEELRHRLMDCLDPKAMKILESSLQRVTDQMEILKSELESK